jgi:2-C-methyl-D-erythritol 4-phosphate cytidylyltransferase
LNVTEERDVASWGIVLAAGSGERFGGRKQFAEVAGRRLVDLAVEGASMACDRTVLVLPPEERWTGSPVDAVVPGGQDRAASVRAALAVITDEQGIAVVHQAANPLASAELFARLLATIEAGAPAAFPGLRPADLVRTVKGDLAGAVVGRDELVLVQTPAAFRLEVLREAHALVVDAVEDTARVSAAGYDVSVIPGDPRNVHVATPEDLEVVAALLRQRGG